MKILYIIGNGFDLNLGLKTKYKHFYSYYEKVDSNSDNINNMKTRISGDYESWSDLELGLGKHTEHIHSLEEFDEVYDDIGEQLAEYLIREEAKIDIEKINKNIFFEHLSFPEESLTPGRKEEIITFKNKWKNNYWYVSIFTLNYTRIIDNILGDKINNLPLGKHDSVAPISLLRLEHIHGYSDDRMVMGVNDISQIANKDFHEMDDILDSLVKSNCNKAHDHKIDVLFSEEIGSSNLICIFGSSIGETDKCWWELIGKRIKEDCRLIIFSQGKEVKKRSSHKNNRIATQVKNLFLDKTGLSEEEKLKVSSKIYVGINTKMFDKLLNQ